MYRHAEPIEVPGPTVDVVGTGGDRREDGQHLHHVRDRRGRRGRPRGQARQPGRVLGLRARRTCSKQLGVRLDLTPARVAEVAERGRDHLLLRAAFHPAFRHAGVPRARSSGVPTTFNVLGPLTNPAQAEAQAVGVADRGWRR